MEHDGSHHAHDVPGGSHGHERRTLWVTVLTAATMIVEIVAGSMTHSMALLADGWHMATHAGALGLAAGAYWYARKHAGAGRYSFGTGKVYALAGYTNAVALGVVAILMLVEAARRVLQPSQIHFDEALPVAIGGLVVNLVSARLLDVEGEHGDHNLRAAYVHVLADALTSVLAIAALCAGRFFGLGLLDPLSGIVGALVILRWSAGLCRDSARHLLDANQAPELAAEIRRRIEAEEGARVVDLHVWQIAPGRRGCIVSLVAAAPRDTAHYRGLVLSLAPGAHVTVEVQRAP